MAGYSLDEIDSVKTKPVPITYGFLYPLNLRLSYFFLNFTKLSANHITVISFIFTLFSACAFLKHFFFLGCLLRLIRYLLDSVDGTVARVTKTSSRLGGLLDNVFGYLSLIILFGVLIYINVPVINIFIYPILLILFFLHPLQVIFMTILMRSEGHTESKYRELFCFQDIRFFALTIVPLFAYINFYFQVNLANLLVVLVIMSAIKQLFWLVHYKKEISKLIIRI